MGMAHHEFAGAFAVYLKEQLAQTPFYRRNPSSFEGVHQLAEVFVRQHYAPPRQATPEQSEKLLQTWQELRVQLWRVIVLLKVSGKFR